MEFVTDTVRTPAGAQAARPAGRPARTAMVIAAILACAFAVAVAALALSSGGAAGPVLPPGSESAASAGLRSLPATARGEISAAVGSSMPTFAVRPSAGGVLAATSGPQRLSTRFGTGGVTASSGSTSIGLSLRSAAFGARPLALAHAAPRSSANAVTYDRGPLVEWYRNGPLGLEQGFTVGAPARPAGALLRLELALSGSATARMRRGLVTLASPGGPQLTYGGLSAADARGRVLPSHMSLRGRAIVLSVNTAGAAFPVRIDPFLQQGGKLTGSGAVKEARFGWGGALSSDGNTAAVGGPGDNLNTGAVWIFTRSGSTWTQQGAKLTGAAEVGAGRFGTSVALSGDGNTLLVGGESDASNVGSAWVFTRSGSTWTQQGGKLTGGGESGSGRFGVAVSLSSDGNTALVGGWSDGGSAGAAWLFKREGSTWSQLGSKLTPSSGQETGKGEFGERVALSGDGSTALIGAPGDNANVGAAWVFARSGTSYTQQGGKLTGGEESGAGRFAGPVALSSEGNTALIGGRSDNANHGAAWVFTRAGSSWSQQGGKITPTGESGEGEFGWSDALSASGDLAIVGARADASLVGAAWVFQRSGTTWSQQGGKLTGSGETGAGEFGDHVALSAEGHTALVGGQSDNVVGAAWVLQASTPQAVTGAAGEIGSGGATLSGTVNPAGEALTECRFEYGTSEAYGSSVPCSTLPGAGTTPVPVSATVSGLTPGTTYHFRLVATEVGGTGSGADATFTTTPGLAPAVTTGAASSVTQHHAQIAGTVNPRGETVSDCRVEYGTSEAYGSSTPCSSLPGGGTGVVAVGAALSGLSAGTEYHYRLAATNPSGTGYGEGATFTTPAAGAPVSLTGAAGSVTQLSAELAGTVNPEDEALSACSFEYGTSEAYGSSVACSTLPGPGASPVAVSAALAGLEPGTTYHYRLSATNPTGTGSGADATFTTAPRRAPALTGETASPVSQTTATLRAAVNPEDETVSACTFEYGATEAYGHTAPCVPSPGSGAAPVEVSAALEGLSPRSTYHFRVVATNGTGTSFGADQTFATSPEPPAVVTGAASSVSQHSAQIAGTVNPEGAPVSSCEVEYGPTEAYGSSAPCSSLPGSGSEPVAVGAALSGLAADTTYHYRVAAANAGGGSHGADGTFTTVVEAPTLVTLAPSALGQTSATLRASVNPNGGNVSSCSFEYGTSESYGSTVPCSSLPGSGTAPVTVTAPVGSLAAGTTYHFRVLATNPGGSSQSADATFATASPALPEIGRCRALPKATGKYTTATCTTYSAGRNTGKYEWTPWPAAKNGFSVTGPTTYLETTGKARLTCTSNRLTGEYTGSQSIAVQVAFEGCEGSAGFSGKCGTAGHTPGEIVTFALTGHLGVIKTGSVPSLGFDILPPPGKPFAEFLCGPIPLSVGGSVIAPIAKPNKMSASFQLLLKASRGLQIPEKLEGEPKDTLTMSALGHEEGVGITFGDVLTNEEPVELKATE